MRRPVATSSQDAPHRQPEMPREIVGLIESASHAAPWMERHGHDSISAGQEIHARLAHGRGQARRQHAPAFVLEHVNDPAQRTVVPACASGQRDWRRSTLASRAARTRGERRQCVATPHAPGRRDPRQVAPAHGADRTVEWPIEHRLARDAAGREQHADDRVGGADEHAPRSTASRPPAQPREFLSNRSGPCRNCK